MNEPIILNERYRLEEQLGSGGMALVYRARDLMLERPVAVKILRSTYSDDDDFRERFRQEARAAANLSHPNIVTVHDFGLDRGRLFIVMEHVPGTHLKDLIRRQGRFQVADAIDLIVQACAGVGYAHRAGIVHCDIKPHNILITPDMRVKVTDFGIARALASIQPEEKNEVVWGSPQYFSPEQAAGEPPSPASDVYSLGVAMYELLTGVLPFAADTAAELSRLHREELPPSPRRYNSSIPPALEQIQLKVLAKEPSARYRTADQFGRVLLTFRQRFIQAEEIALPVEPEPVLAEETRVPVGSVPYPAPINNSYPHAAPHPQAGQVRASNHAPRPLESRNQPEENPLAIDWMTILLALLALLAVGGLFPFYLWIYYLYR